MLCFERIFFFNSYNISVKCYKILFSHFSDEGNEITLSPLHQSTQLDLGFQPRPSASTDSILTQLSTPPLRYSHRAREAKA